MRALLVILIFYLIFRFIRNISVFTMRSHSVPQDDPAPSPPPAKQKKIIDKDEGEYVDYEEVRK